VGQKVNPIGLRLGIIKDWRSRWFARRSYGDLLHEDIKIRNFIKEKMPFAGISTIEIERVGDKVRINLHTARPGIVIGRKGQDIDRLREDIQELTKKEIDIEIKEIQHPEIDAYLVAENIAQQLERRVGYRRAMKQAVAMAMDRGIGGIKICCAGRLGGAEMKRTAWYRQGRVPLHTLRADIEFGQAESLTTYGKIGVKVWIFYKEILPEADNVPAESEEVIKGQEVKDAVSEEGKVS
jgi:small subunit ribosomal protein S3